MMTEKPGSATVSAGPSATTSVVTALVLFCTAWAVMGTMFGPQVASPSRGPWEAIATWAWLAACPVAFWFAGQAASRGLLLPSLLTGLALLLTLGRATGALDVHPNDLASLLALLLPWWTVLALLGIPKTRPSMTRPSKTPQDHLGVFRWFLLVPAAACVATLLWTGSRGGLLAAGVGTLAGLVVASSRQRRRLLVLSLAFVAALIGALLPAAAKSDSPPYESARNWFRDHDAEGFTWAHLGTGRPTIWRQATRVIEDFPVFGSGPGSFGVLVPDVYAPPIRRIDLYDPDALSPRVDDAHNLYLESAVAFGLPFLAAFVALCVLGVGRLARNGSGAALGGLLAYLLHGLVDCPAPGSIVYLAGWAALGGACCLEPEITSSLSRRRVAKNLTLRFVVAVWVLLAVGIAVLLSRPNPCQEAWTSALRQGSLQNEVAVAVCDPRRIADLAARHPFDADRSRAVFDARPSSPDALRWRLWTTSDESDLPAGYLQYFGRRPADADAKMEFLRRVPRSWQDWHPELVLSLLAHACAHGDPGANACLGAGNLARRLDLDPAVADSFYLASEWPGARRLATGPRGDEPR